METLQTYKNTGFCDETESKQKEILFSFEHVLSSYYVLSPQTAEGKTEYNT